MYKTPTPRYADRDTHTIDLRQCGLYELSISTIDLRHCGLYHLSTSMIDLRHCGLHELISTISLRQYGLYELISTINLRQCGLYQLKHIYDRSAPAYVRLGICTISLCQHTFA